MKYKIISALLTCLAAAVFLCPAVSQAISIPEEKKLAKEFMEQINRKNMLLHDPVAVHFVRQIGNHILSFLPPQPFDFTFHVVDENLFNAFAAPGANIFAYRGLITSLDTADELAGIIGHEIAHAANRHVSESIDRSKYISIGSLAGMLAGAIIGSNTDGEAAQTLMTGSLALGATAQLAFTRENETEADELGIMFLKQSCFSPKGLLSGLMKIREADFRGVEGIPDYVKTHPGTTSRIAHTEAILSTYVPSGKKQACHLDFDFDMVKYRLLGLYGQIDPVSRKLEQQLAASPENAAVHYGMGLLYARKPEHDKALFHLKKALEIKLLDTLILTDLGRIYLLNGSPEKALNILTGLENEPVTGLMARYHKAVAHLELRELERARQGLTAVINKAPTQFPKAFYHMANIMALDKKTGLSHYYLGLYYLEIKNRKNASVHFKKAIETLGDKDKIEDAREHLKKLKKPE